MKSKKSIIMYTTTIFLILFILIFLLYAFYQRSVIIKQYEHAKELLESNNYNEAIDLLETLQDYKDGSQLLANALNEKKYSEGIELLKEKKFNQAIDLFMQIENFKDSSQKIVEAKYNIAVEYYNNNDYDNAKKIFIELGSYLESDFYLAQIDIKTLEQSQKTIFKKATSYYNEKKSVEAIELWNSIIDYGDSRHMINECILQLKRISNINKIAAGIRNSSAISSERTVLVVGSSYTTQQNINKWKNIISIDIYGNLIIGLQEDQTVEIAGKYDGDKEITNTNKWENIIDIAAGEQFVVGLKEDGTVIADGHGDDGQLNVEDWKDVVAIDAGSRFTVALTKDKELLFAGYDNGQSLDFEMKKDDWKDVVNIAASGGEKNYTGGGHTVGLKSDGTLVAVGDNRYGQCDFSDTEKWSDIVKVATGDWYTVGLKSNGSVVITGENFPGHKYIDENMLAKCTNIVDIAAGYGHTLCLTDTGEIIAFGFNDDNKCEGTMSWNNLMTPKY